MWLNILLLIAGILLILLGADKLTDGATGLARRLGIPEMVIGLTVVAFGTSLPEFVTSFVSSLQGSSELSIGNIVGSNIFNVLVIVGASAIVAPIRVSRSTVAKDIPFTLLASVILLAVVLDSVFDGSSADYLSRVDGIVLLGYFSVFMVYTYYVSKNKEESADAAAGETARKHMSYMKISLNVIIGLCGLIFGGNLFVNGASAVAISLGVSETIVGLTIVAAGTSLPELATSLVAAKKGSSAIAIGNVIGSNIFNIFFVMGTCALITPMNADSISYLDLILMLLSAILLWGFSYTRRILERWEGFIMVIIYISYVSYLVYQV